MDLQIYEHQLLPTFPIKTITISFADSLKLSVENLRILNDLINRSMMPSFNNIRYFFNSTYNYDQAVLFFEKLNIEFSTKIIG